MRRPSIAFLIYLAAAIYVMWVALTIGELWPLHRVLAVPSEFRERIFNRDVFAGPRFDISPREAHLLWVIRDPEPADGTFDVFSDNLNTMLSRSRPLELAITIPLDILALIFGESFILIRLISIAAAGMIVAGAVRLIVLPLAAVQRRRHLRRPTLWPLLFGGLFACAVLTAFMGMFVHHGICINYGDQLHSAVDAYIASHKAGEPVLTIFGEDSRFAHFAATRDLRLGNRIDLSQRQFTASEIDDIIEGLENDRVWVLFERGAPVLDTNLDAVLAAIHNSGRGRPFIRGPISEFTTSAMGKEFLLKDYWQIYGYDANVEFQASLSSKLGICW